MFWIVEEKVNLEDNGGGLVNELFDDGEEKKLHNFKKVGG